MARDSVDTNVSLALLPNPWYQIVHSEAPVRLKISDGENHAGWQPLTYAAPSALRSNGFPNNWPGSAAITLLYKFAKDGDDCAEVVRTVWTYVRHVSGDLRK